MTCHFVYHIFSPLSKTDYARLMFNKSPSLVIKRVVSFSCVYSAFDHEFCHVMTTLLSGSFTSLHFWLIIGFLTTAKFTIKKTIQLARKSSLLVISPSEIESEEG